MYIHTRKKILKVNTHYWVVFLFICFMSISNTNAIQLFINSETGQLSTIRPDNTALWPNEYGECVESFDAEYIEHDDRYHVEEWFFAERVYPNTGAFATKVTIHDCEQMVREAYREGVWYISGDCEEVTNVMKNRLLLPLFHSINQQGRSYLTARLYGMIVNFQCKNARQYEIGEDYHTCTGNELHTITRSSSDSIHERRAKIVNDGI